MKSSTVNTRNINDLIAEWYKQIRGNNSFTEADAEELKDHLLEMMEDLQRSGLTEEESYIIATRRIGEVNELESDYLTENLEIIQIRRSAVILAGVLIYFLSFHLIGSLTKLFFITLLENDVSGLQALVWLKRSLWAAHLFYILLFTSLLVSEQKVITAIENLKFRPKHALIFLILTFLFGVANVSLMAVAKSVIGDDLGLRGWFLHYYIYNEYTFPLLFCVGFILIYFKYYRKAKF